MKREKFVLAYRLKSEPNSKHLRCLACHIHKGPSTYGICGGLSCTQKKFNNNLHVAVITMKGCNFAECSRASCNRCVMYLKFGVTRNL